MIVKRNLLAFHPSLGHKIAITPRELVLDRVLLMKDSPIYAFAHDLVESFDIFLVKDSHRTARLISLADSLADGDVTFADLEVLLQVADIGVMKVDIEETNIPDLIRQVVRRVQT